jgi:hypothetical protein
MRILEFGSLGYQIGAGGIIAFTVAFLVSVRWWTDWLGRVIAGVLFSTSAVLVVVVLRQLFPEWEGSFLIVRAAVFWFFGVSIWISLASFVWSQFFAPRIKGSRLVRVTDHTKGSK